MIGYGARVSVRWGSIAKGVFITLALIAAVAAMPTGVAMVVLKDGWGKVLGLVLLVGGFRLMILVLDLTWERPPQFSKRPWEEGDSHRR